MKIFLTGATGKVGSRFAKYLLNKGMQVRVLVRDLDRAKFLQEQGAELILGDLSDKEALINAISGTDAVVHLAAQFRGVTEEVAWESNVNGTKRLAEAALEAHVTRFIFSSTSLVYMDTPHTKPCLETDFLDPQGLYPKTKVASENILMNLKKTQGLDLRILRFAFVYGDGDEHLAEFTPIMQTWNTEQKMSMIHHADICRALYLAITTEKAATGIYNVADDTPSSVGELLEYVQAAPIETENSSTLNPFGMIQSTQTIEKELSFKPKYASYKAAYEAGAL